jgi:uncharacterized protein (TIGR02246 family)
MNDDDTRATIERFHEAFNRHDIDAVAQLLTEDCVFEDTGPPDGTRHVGREAVLAGWRGLFADTPAAHFDAEEITTTADRAVVRRSGGAV